mgnify:FL=1
MGNPTNIHAVNKGKLVDPVEADNELFVLAGRDKDLLKKVVGLETKRIDETRPPLQRFHGPKVESK